MHGPPPTPDEFEALRRRYVYALARGVSHEEALLVTARHHRLSLTETDHHLGDPRSVVIPWVDS